MYYQYIDTDFQRFYPLVTKFLGIKHKKLSYFKDISHNKLCIKNGHYGGNMKCLKSIQTIYFWKVLDKTSILKKI